MADTLRKIAFTEHLVDDVKDFECGTEEWEKPLANWIKAAPNVRNGASYELRKRKGKLQIWLYVNEEDELVGYSALGESNWQWPTADDPRVPVSVIPNVAIQKKYWGEPKHDPPKYSAQILGHLIFEARQHSERHPLLGLFVDQRNTRAIGAYERSGFQKYFRKFFEDGIEYQSMLLNLPSAEPTKVVKGA